jgi:hypothetical protein
VDTSELRLPDLTDLPLRLRNDRMLGNMLGIHGPPTPRGKQLADGYVRLVERTLIEYEAGRAAMNRFLAAERGPEHYYAAQDHFENCVRCLHRAIEFLERLRRAGLKDGSGSPFIPRPRDLEVISAQVRDQVRELRDALEHLDDDILAGRIDESARTDIHAGWTAVQLGDHRLVYEDIASWIRQLYHFASMLSRFEIQVGTQPATAPDEA